MPEFDVAIAHDYLTQRGGAERVVLALARAFPQAPIYTTLYAPESTYPAFAAHSIHTTWLNRIALFRKSHRLALPLFAPVVGSTDISAQYTIMSSSGWAHGFRASGAKIVYCYSPARWLYQSDTYIGTDKFGLKQCALRVTSPFLKRWDRRKAEGATKYFAISTAVQKRIEEAYGIHAEVLPAPHSIDISLIQDAVDISKLRTEDGGFYLCISRLLPYKNVDAVIGAFAKLKLPLVVVGAGPDERRLAESARGENILLLKNLTDGQIRWLYAHCEAVVSASYEDFGLTPIEAAAYGKPSVVLRWGGFLDTIREGVTGIFFDEPVPDQICAAIDLCRNTGWDSSTISAHSKLFAEERFVCRLLEEIRSIRSAERKSASF